MNTIKILYIEDDAKLRAEYTEKLKQRSFIVDTAASGKEGIAHYREQKPELVLCDLNMPEMNGLDVLKELKRFDPGVVVIILTSHGTISLAVEAIKNGAYDFILKPFEIDEMETTIIKAVENKKLQEQLIRSQADLHALMENVPDIIYSLNPQGQFTNVSPAGKTILGYEPADFIGTSVFDIIHPDDRERIRASFSEAMKTGVEQVRTVEFRMLTKTGESKNFEVRARSIVKNGTVVKSDGIARDMTEKKRLENELGKYVDGLEKIVARRTESLEFANRQLVSLNVISNIFAQTLEEEELIKKATELLIHYLEFQCSMLFVAENDRLKLKSFHIKDVADPAMIGVLQQMEQDDARVPDLFYECLKEEKTIFLPEYERDKSSELMNVMDVQAMIITPLRIQKEPIGVIVVCMNDNKIKLDQQDVALFEMFANMLGLSLDIAHSYQLMEKKVEERTKSMISANAELDKRAKELEKKTYEIGKANLKLYAIQEELEDKNEQMKKLLDELSQRQNELQSILDTTPNAIVMVNPEGIITSANRQVMDIFGLASEEIIHQPFDDFLEDIKDCFENYDEFRRIARDMHIDHDEFLKQKFDPFKLYDHGVKLLRPEERIIVPVSIPVRDSENNVLGKIWSYSDITRIKQSYDQLRTIVNASPIPLIVTRLKDSRILFVNDHLASLIGYDISELMDKQTPDFYANPDDRKFVLQKIRENGYLPNHEIQIRKEDGSTIWVILSAQMTKLGGDNVAISGLYDIDERKQAERELRRERNFVSAVLDTAGALVLVLDTQGKIVRFNRACEQITGYTYDEVEGRYFADLFLLHEERERVENVFESLCTGNFPNEAENFWLTKSGDKRLIAWSNTALVDSNGEVEYIVSIGNDRTDAKAMEDALQKSELKYRELVENSNSIMLRWDRDGNILFFNEFAQQFFGYEEEEILGQNVMGTIVPEVDSSGLNLAELIDAIEQYPDHYLSNENENIKRNGERVWITWANKPIFDEKGTLKEILSIGKDVTDRKKAEEELKRAHEIYQAAIENANGVPYLKNYEKNVYDFIGQGIESLLGIPAKDLTVQVMSNVVEETIISDAGMPQDKKKYGEKFLRGEVDRYRVDLKIKTPTGHIKWISDCSIPVKDENTGKVVGSLGILQDITERKEIENRLQLYRHIFMNTNDGIMVFDEQGQLMERNPANREFLGFDDDQIKGKPSEYFFGEESTENIINDLIRKGSYRGEIKGTSENNEQYDIDLSIFSVRNDAGEFLCYVGIGRDISERKRAEQAMATRLRYEEGLAACSQTLLSESKPDIVLNKALGHLINASKAHRVSIFKNFVEEQDGLCMKQSFLVRAKGVAPYSETVNLQKIPYKNGFLRWQDKLSKNEAIVGRIHEFPESERDILKAQGNVSILILPLWVENQWYGFISFDNMESSWVWSDDDIRLLQTAAEMVGIYIERKKVLEDLENANRNLKETQIQLIQTEKMASLGTLVAGVAHEINTPVGAIHSMHNTLMRSISKLQDVIRAAYPDVCQENAEFRKIVKIISDSNRVISTGTDRVTNIVKRLRSFARLDESDLKQADIHEGLEDTLSLVHHELKHTVSVIKNYGDISPVLCYPGQLNQVFLNLLMNAKQAIKENGEIRITTRSKDNYIFIELEDNGVGIPEKNLGKIFDPGFTTKGVGVGTGLGLSICYQIIEHHHGKIDVESEVGKGTKFTIRLPIHPNI